jgi:carboxyl-terminal processing protease
LKFIVIQITKYFALISAVCLLGLASCHKDDTPDINNGISSEVRSVNNYIYSNMKYYYLWTEFIPSGLDPEKESDPVSFFNKMLYKADDKWSYITDDYQGLINSFQGIGKSFGYRFKLFKEASGNHVFGIIEYIIPGSPADNAGVKRGDVFSEINDTQLDTANYRNLLYTSDTYTLGFANLVDGQAVSNGVRISITAVSLEEDPVFYSNVYDAGGEKIGYLVYNQFINSYNDELRNVFMNFKTEGINDLILDFRYNPGGSVNTAQVMASMIAPQDVVTQENVFAKYIWNADIDAYYIKNQGTDSQNLILKFLPAEAANNLNLNRVYILTSNNTASASELIINGLKPYMQVVTLGAGTVGKYTASITLHDQSKSYNWAIQPIVVKLANADDISDYKDGFTPDYPVADDYFSPLGSLDEGMLSNAVSVITGVPVDLLARKRQIPVPSGVIPLITPSGNQVRDHHLMLIDNFVQ